MPKTVFIDNNPPGVRVKRVVATFLNGISSPKLSSVDANGNFNIGYEDPRTYGDGTRMGANIALACAAAAVNGNIVVLMGGVYDIIAVFGFHGVPIAIFPGSHINFHTGCAPQNLLIYGDPLWRLFSGAQPVSFNNGSLTHFRPEWYGALAGSISDASTAFQNTIIICSGTDIPIILNGNYRIDSTHSLCASSLMW